MSELTNPLFDEKEFLERKKLEYERALVADVEKLKVQSMQVGKIAAVGAGAVAGIWLLNKLFGGPKKAKTSGVSAQNGGGFFRKNQKRSRAAAPRAEAKDTFDLNTEFYTDGRGVRHRSVPYHKSAAQSAATFQEHEVAGGDDGFANAVSPAFGSDIPADDARTDDGGFGGFDSDDAADHRDPDLIGAEVFASAYAAANTARPRPADNQSKAVASTPRTPAALHANEQPEAYIPSHGELYAADARAAASSPADTDPFAEFSPPPVAAGVGRRAISQSLTIRYGRDFAGSVVSSFLQSEAGRVLLAQAAAVALALVTKQLGRWFPGQPEVGAEVVFVAPLTETDAATAKNADLAAASAVAPFLAAPRFPEPAASSDDPLTPSQSLT